jgi:two-component system phosphate regulon response regulator OmpR
VNDIPRARILICDDEPHLREMVGEYLGARGSDVLQAKDAAALHTVMKDDPPDMILLDVTMPGEDGLSALRTLRMHHQTPVIMLTASAEVIDRIVGLEMGADDYLGKPVDLRELEARIKAALRRQGGVEQPAEQAVPTGMVQFGTCQLDVAAKRLFDASGSEIPMTAMEIRLLIVFADHPAQVLSRDQLLEMAHERSWEPFDRSIDLRISRLRRKIEANPTKPEVIRTVRGLGYVFG